MARISSGLNRTALGIYIGNVNIFPSSPQDSLNGLNRATNHLEMFRLIIKDNKLTNKTFQNRLQILATYIQATHTPFPLLSIIL